MCCVLWPCAGPATLHASPTDAFVTQSRTSRAVSHRSSRDVATSLLRHHGVLGNRRSFGASHAITHTIDTKHERAEFMCPGRIGYRWTVT